MEAVTRRAHTDRIDGSAIFFAWFAAIVWGIFAVCLTALALGQRDAINPVIAIPLPALLATWAAVSLHRQDKRFTPR